MNDQRKMKNLEWTPEMIEVIKNMKPFDYKKHEDEIKKFISSSEGPRPSKEVLKKLFDYP